EQQKYGPGNYVPNARATYWAMRGMAYLGSLVALVAVVGAFLFWKRRLEKLRWFLWSAVAATFFPFLAAASGWVLTEMGRQPWIVQGLLRTADANSPSVSTTWLAISLSGFITLYIGLLAVDIWLMRRYANVDPTGEPEEAVEAPPVPAF